MEAFADWLFVVLWLLGVLLTFLPFVPATLVILLAAFLHELLLGFRELSLGVWLLLGVLALLAMTLDNLAALLGAALVAHMMALLPYFMALAAGAMVYVIVEEVIPESQKESGDISTLGAMLGFAVMMALDVALG